MCGRKKINVKKIDTDFTALFTAYLSRQAGIDEITEYIRKQYFPIAYLYAASILSKSGGTGDFANDAAELAVEAMEDILRESSAGELSFKGKSVFSTYLYKTIVNKNREGKKIYYPAEVKRRGMPAIEAYRLLLVEKYGPLEVFHILQQEYGLDWEESNSFIALVESYREDEAERNRKRQGAAEDVSYDAMIDTGAPLDNQPASGKKHPTPPEAVIRQEQLEILRKAVELLPEPAKSVVKGYVLEEKWETLKEMEEELNLKNGSYEIQKARQLLREIMK